MYAVVDRVRPAKRKLWRYVAGFDYNVVGIGKSFDEALRRFKNALEDTLRFYASAVRPIPEPHYAVTSV